MRKNSLAVQQLITDLAFPEGPLCLKDRSIWLVEKEAGNLVHFKEGKTIRHFVGGQPNGLALDRQDNIWYCDAGNNSICRFTSSNNSAETIVDKLDNNPLNHPNDLAFDTKGNLIFTCSGNALHKFDGYICCLTPAGSVSILAKDMNYPNGLALSADGKKLYIAETGSTKIWCGDWDATGLTWKNTKAVITTGGAVGPDGIAFDEDENLYIAVYGEGKINVYNKTYSLVEEIRLEGQNPTNCAFDPTGKLGLVITEAENGKLWHRQSSYRGILS